MIDPPRDTMPVTRCAVSGHVGQPDAGVDGEVIDPLLGLLDQRVLEHLPVELERVAVDLLQRLVDRHGADRDRGIAQDPGPDVVDVAAGRQVHHRVGAPADRPDQLFHLFGDAGADGRIADVGVDLHQEVAPDDHRLEFEVVDIGRQDGAARGRSRRARSPASRSRGSRPRKLSPSSIRRRAPAMGGPSQILAMGRIDHLLGDEARAGELVLGHGSAGLPDPQGAPGLADRHQPAFGEVTVVLRPHPAALRSSDIHATRSRRRARAAGLR